MTGTPQESPVGVILGRVKTQAARDAQTVEIASMLLLFAGVALAFLLLGFLGAAGLVVLVLAVRFALQRRRS